MLMALTDKAVKAALAKQALGTELRCATTTGLVLRVGKKRQTWCIHTSINGKSHRVRLGYWPSTSTDEARLKALQWLKINRDDALSNGIFVSPALLHKASTDAARPRESVTSSPTLAQVLHLYIDSKQLAESTAKSYRKAINHQLKPLSQQAIYSLNSNDIRQLYRQLLQSQSSTTANQAMRILSALYHWWCASTDTPAIPIFKALKQTKEQQPSKVRSRTLSETDIRHMARSRLSATERLFVQLALCTGLRLSELRSLKPGSINWQSGTLHIPQTKNGKPHILPLTPQLEALFKGATVGKNGCYLPARTEHLAREIAEKTGIPCSTHDFRRTTATLLARLNTPLHKIKAILNHAAGSVTEKVYIWLSADDIRVEMQALSVYIEKLMVI